MSKPKIAIIIGNGFSLSFDKFSGLSATYNSQEPLSWSVACPTTKRPFLESLPNLQRFITQYEGMSDFDIFKKITELSDAAPRDYLNKAQLEARHYLSLAFAEYTLRQKLLLDKFNDWPWYRWLNAHRDEVDCLVSFNYDILLESIFEKLNRTFFTLASNSHGHGIPLVKPHGSSDFEMAPNIIGGLQPSYPLRNYIDENNTPIIRLKDKDFLAPRLQAHCIIPNEKNKYINYQWVKPAYDLAKEKLKNCTHLVIIGHSYAESDRLEVDDILDATNKSAEIIIANPSPPKELITRLNRRPTIIWSSFEGPISNSGQLSLLKRSSNNMTLPKCFCRSGKSYKYCCGQNLG